MIGVVEVGDTGEEEDIARNGLKNVAFKGPRDVLESFPAPSMEWFGHEVARRPRPHLSCAEEAALGERVVDALLVFDLHDHAYDRPGELVTSSAEDIAELN